MSSCCVIVLGLRTVLLALSDCFFSALLVSKRQKWRESVMEMPTMARVYKTPAEINFIIMQYM
ncbi:hypothetical protein VCRA2113O415_290048 [Vibrio crassostreae]|nr:hypothetical protein VCRA2113O415_290048 [Vibrio crassostreae]CAK2779290.1 hypothetical protein VCRA2113O420_300048 [Vibrio crassostreae]CAK3387094.1 hypothetical protein VCRA2121O436_300035 [Vibrio crassostreae]